MAFLELNGMYVPVEEGSAQLSSSVRRPGRSLSGRVFRSGFGVGRMWKFKTGFLTMSEARILRVLFTGYLPGFPGVSRYGASWASRGAPEVASTHFPPPYLACSGEMMGTTGVIKCEGRLVDTNWVSRTICVLELELYEVLVSEGGFDSAPDTTKPPMPTPIGDPNGGQVGGGGGGGGGEVEYDQYDDFDVGRADPGTGASYVTLNGFEGMFDSFGGSEVYDADGNLITGDVPLGEPLYEMQGGELVPMDYRVRPTTYQGKPAITRPLTSAGTTVHIFKRLPGPCEVSLDYFVDTSFDAGGLTVYATGETNGRYISLVQQSGVQQSGGGQIYKGEGRLSAILPGEQVWKLQIFFNGANEPLPADAGANTFYVYNLDYEMSAKDDEIGAPSAPSDPNGELNDWGNTTPEGSTHLGNGWFTLPNDSVLEPRSGERFVAAPGKPWNPQPSTGLIFAPNLAVGESAILRQRLAGPGVVEFMSVVPVVGEGAYEATFRVANVATNLTFSLARQSGRSAQYNRYMDVCGGTPELQVIVKKVAHAESSEYTPSVSYQLNYAVGAGHGPKIQDGYEETSNDPLIPSGATVIRDGYYRDAADDQYNYEDLLSVADAGRGAPGFTNPALAANGAAVLHKRFQGPGTVYASGRMPGNGVLLVMRADTAQMVLEIPAGPADWTEGSLVLPDAQVYDLLLGIIDPDGADGAGLAYIEDLVFVPGSGGGEEPEPEDDWGNPYDPGYTPGDGVIPPGEQDLGGGYYGDAWTNAGGTWTHPDIGHSEQTEFRRQFQGPGTVAWDFTVSSEQNFDFFQVILRKAAFDGPGRLIVNESGQTALNVSQELDGDVYELIWRYFKDSSADDGTDSATVSNITFTPS